MKRFFVIVIPIVTLALFILIMLSDSFLKQPLGKGDNIPELIQLLMQDVEGERWADASKKTDQLAKAWKTIVHRVQFSAEKDEMNAFEVSMARLRGSIITKNKAYAIIELNEAYEHWENIGK